LQCDAFGHETHEHGARMECDECHATHAPGDCKRGADVCNNPAHYLYPAAASSAAAGADGEPTAGVALLQPSARAAVCSYPHSLDATRCRYCHARGHPIWLCASPRMRCAACHQPGHFAANPFLCALHPKHAQATRMLKCSPAALAAGTAPSMRVRVLCWRGMDELRFYDWKSAGISMHEMLAIVREQKLQMRHAAAPPAPATNAHYHR
jgi:hypothetical protein